ncbi:hypothetical protein NDU88_006256 [Pleurodeles waltl]|uniref:Uncharacterized protein n=1 Tax=Pleurodeles waltl TaxID=8319 RepID=A0AAV7VP83_PLEWA|nr:hypothetical protein NDU88_006256 [Pleurodeles waltl]
MLWRRPGPAAWRSRRVVGSPGFPCRLKDPWQARREEVGEVVTCLVAWGPGRAEEAQRCRGGGRDRWPWACCLEVGGADDRWTRTPHPWRTPSSEEQHNTKVPRRWVPLLGPAGVTGVGWIRARIGCPLGLGGTAWDPATSRRRAPRVVAYSVDLGTRGSPERLSGRAPGLSPLEMPPPERQ